MKAVICPVCGGTGKVKPPSSLWKSDEEKTCHGCSGRGWVEVRD